jgi:hypothetical protein
VEEEESCAIGEEGKKGRSREMTHQIITHGLVVSIIIKD